MVVNSVIHKPTSGGYVCPFVGGYAHKGAGSSNPPQRESRTPVITPVRAAQSRRLTSCK